jgi:cytochrome c biogenesis protein CcdA
MLEISFVAAFAGGVLSLLAPCSALLLPAFFAYAFTSRTQLLGRTLLFLAGLSTVFVPLGMGASLVAALLLDYRDVTVLLAGLLLVAFGVLELVGGGFTLVPADALARFQGQRSVVAVYATGLVYGLAGFCSGPLLGSVLTLAGSAANPLLGGVLLFTFAVGTAAPLFVIAYFWDRLQLGRARWLLGRPLRLRGWAVQSTNLIAGLLFILLGASFIAFQGGSTLSAVYDDLGLAELGFRLQTWIADRQGNGADPVVGVVVGGLAGAWALRRHRHQRISSAPSRIAASDTK